MLKDTVSGDNWVALAERSKCKCNPRSFKQDGAQEGYEDAPVYSSWQAVHDWVGVKGVDTMSGDKEPIRGLTLGFTLVTLRSS